ncbi:PAS domain S-box protein [Oscillatoria acuminata]|uniref:Methyl-accepting chemotaxis sensory transducer with Pas/Pac sensor n=1 Tax=Oscillatoria acuminata PCC 6304 TaxID=56110 RepID=K9THH3_9CYAN|nr:PAS domain S-box protein [Oscillatoria acuminata]AFY82000.1 methyl-accepting chemotaxis sensory transducer with Pas/Pac sensor [Oscillatoria acuminata PCC 6304]
MLINGIGFQLYFAIGSAPDWVGIQNWAEWAIALSYLGMTVILLQITVSRLHCRFLWIVSAFLAVATGSRFFHLFSTPILPVSTAWQTLSYGLEGVSAIAVMIALFTYRQGIRETLGSGIFSRGSFLQMALDGLPWAVSWQDSQGVYLGGNQRFAEQVGVTSPAQVIGKTNAGLCWGGKRLENWAKINPEDSQTLLVQVPNSYPGDGSESLWKIHQCPVKTSQEKPVGIASTYEKFPGYAEAIASNFTEFLNQIEEGFLIQKRDGTILDANEKASQLYGMERTQLRGKNFFNQLSSFGQSQVDFEAAVSKGGSLRWKALKPKAGSFLDVEISGKPLTLVDNREVMGVSVRDVSSCLKLETELRQREEEFKLFLEHLPAAVAMLDRQMCYVMVSQRWVKDYKLDHREDFQSVKNIIGRSHYELFPELPDPVKDKLQRVLEGESFSCDAEGYTRVDGSMDWVKWEMYPWRDRTGEIGGIMLLTEVITDRIQTEQERMRLFNLVESSLNEIYIFDVETLRFEYVNKGACLNLGYSPEEILKKTAMDINPAVGRLEDVKTALTPLLEGREQRIRFEGMHRRADGSIYPIEIYLQLAQQTHKPSCVAIVLDITERKQAERALQESEQQFRLMADTVPATIWIADADKQVTYFNKRWVEFTGRSLEQDLGHGWVQILHPDDRERAVHTYQTAFDKRQPFQLELRFKRWDGEYCWSWMSGLPRFDSEGNFFGYIGSGLDITERKQAEEARRESEEGFRSLVESVKDYAIIRLDVAGRVASWNMGAQRIKGYRAPEILGQPFQQFYTLEDRTSGKPEAELKAAQSEGRFEDEGYRVKKDGSKFWANVIITALRDAKGELQGFSKITRDVTEQRRNQEALEQLAADLENRVDQRTQELQEINEKLQQEVGDRIGAEAEKTQLIADLEIMSAQRQAEMDSLTEQVVKMLGQIKGAAKGDLTVRAAVTNDILGALADSFNFLISSLRKVVTGVQKLATEANTATGESISNTQELAHQAQEQAEKIDETIQKIQKIVNSIEEVFTLSQQAENVAQQAAEKAQVGGDSVDRAVAAINELRQTLSQTGKTIERLGESSGQIGKIVTSISQIAAQTNLLALNATIEAARAGEQGLGFAVVAEEIRKLADRSGLATEEISEIVEQIRSEIGRAIVAMEAGTQEVAIGTKLAAEAKTHLIEIIQVSGEMNALVEHISLAATKQTNSATEIVSMIRAVSAISGNTAEKSVQVQNSLDGLAISVESLQQSVAHFRS